MLYRSCFQHLYEVERHRIITPPNVRMRLNRGEYPEPWPEEFRKALRARLKIKTIQQYPSYPEFYEKLGAFLRVPKEMLVVGAGIEEFIRTLMFLCCDPGQKAVVLWPTCAMYDVYAQAFGVDLIRVTSTPDHPLGMADLIEAVPEDARVVFVPNPGQPVETCFSELQLSLLAYYCQCNDIVLAIDEAHFGFGAHTALPLVATYDNVLVLRTFSKWLAAASIRVGCAVGQPRALKPLEAVRPSGEVTGLSMEVATYLMEHYRYIAELQKDVCIARDSLRFRINTEFGGYVKAYGQYGFSILLRFTSAGVASWVAAALAERGIYIKSRFPKPIENCCLLSCGSQKLMEDFYGEFCEVMCCLKDAQDAELVVGAEVA